MQTNNRPFQRPQGVTPPTRVVPQRSSSQPQPQPVVTTSSPSHHKNQKKRFGKTPVIIAVLALIVLIAGVIGYNLLNNQIMANRYQAVFLDNGQVYFGKLHDYYTDRPYMTDVYYFQSGNQTGASASAQSDQLLVKLGQEIHAPENKLVLNKNSIVFVENLTDGGKVTEAINKDAANGTPTQSNGGITR